MLAITRRAALAVLVLVVVAVVTGVLVAARPWADEESGKSSSGDPRRTSPAETTVLAVGDIGRCNETVDEATAELVAAAPDASLLVLGDVAYNDGSVTNFRNCYAPSWGRFLERTHPVPGNHEYRSEGAGPYFDFFAGRAGERGQGWYSLELGDWHILALNSNCKHIGCDAGSEQERWLRAELEATDARCTLAFMHHPRFSAGADHGGTNDVADLWQALLDHRAELVLSGHNHLYERTAPLDADGAVDPDGIRQFVVGTGGGQFDALGEPIPGDEATIVDTAGVLELTLQAQGYTWEFLPADSAGLSDSGAGECR